MSCKAASSSVGFAILDSWHPVEVVIFGRVAIDELAELVAELVILVVVFLLEDDCLGRRCGRLASPVGTSKCFSNSFSNCLSY